MPDHRAEAPHAVILRRLAWHKECCTWRKAILLRRHRLRHTHHLFFKRTQRCVKALRRLHQCPWFDRRSSVAHLCPHSHRAATTSQRQHHHHPLHCHHASPVFLDKRAQPIRLWPPRPTLK